MYGIKQKYNLKDYIAFFSARDGNGQYCCEEKGFINSVEYSCNNKGEIELSYVVSNYIGSNSGHLIPEEAIIRKEEPKDPNYGYREYLKSRVQIGNFKMKEAEKDIKHYTKLLEELDNGKLR